MQLLCAHVHTEAASLPWPANQIFTVLNSVQLLEWKGHTIGRLRATSCEERRITKPLFSSYSNCGVSLVMGLMKTAESGPR